MKRVFKILVSGAFILAIMGMVPKPALNLGGPGWGSICSVRCGKNLEEDIMCVNSCNDGWVYVYFPQTRLINE